VSVIRQFTVVCEVPECVGVGGRSRLPILSVMTANDAVRYARAHGWRHTSSHDICPACWAAGWRYQGGFYQPTRRKREDPH